MKFIQGFITGLVIGFAATVTSAQTVAVAPERPAIVQDAMLKDSLANQDTVVHLGGVTQFRYSYNNANGSNANGFELPWTRLDVYGDINKVVDFRVSPYVNSNGDFTLEDAYAQFKIEQFGVKVGQFRPLFMREMNVGDEYTTMAAHSVVANTLGQTYTQGLQGTFKANERFSLSAAFTEGNDQENTPVVGNADYAMDGRVDWTALKGANSSLGIGGGVYLSDAVQSYTLDAKYSVGGFAATLAGVYSTNEDLNVDSTGVVGQLAYRPSGSNWEPFVVQEYGDNDVSSSFNISYLGVNYYVGGGSAVKWTNQLGYAYNNLTGWNYENTGFIPNEPHECVLISQLQISF